MRRSTVRIRSSARYFAGVSSGPQAAATTSMAPLSSPEGGATIIGMGDGHHWSRGLVADQQRGTVWNANEREGLDCVLAEEC